MVKTWGRRGLGEESLGYTDSTFHTSAHQTLGSIICDLFEQKQPFGCRLMNPLHSGPKGGIIEKLTDPESEMVVQSKSNPDIFAMIELKTVCNYLHRFSFY